MICIRRFKRLVLACRNIKVISPTICRAAVLSLLLTTGIYTPHQRDRLRYHDFRTVPCLNSDLFCFWFVRKQHNGKPTTLAVDQLALHQFTANGTMRTPPVPHHHLSISITVDTATVPTSTAIGTQCFMLNITVHL
jgi:hypothetical protein